MRIRIQLFILMLIRVLFLIKVMRICDQFEPPRLYSTVSVHGPQLLKLLNFDFSPYPDLVFHSVPDPPKVLRIRNFARQDCVNKWLSRFQTLKLVIFRSREESKRKTNLYFTTLQVRNLGKEKLTKLFTVLATVLVKKGL
jgi:hypothetical protein